jgi:hypothetical protein
MTDIMNMKIINYEDKDCVLIIHIGNESYVSLKPIQMKNEKFKRLDLEEMVFEKL